MKVYVVVFGVKNRRVDAVFSTEEAAAAYVARHFFPDLYDIEEFELDKEYE